MMEPNDLIPALARSGLNPVTLHQTDELIKVQLADPDAGQLCLFAFQKKATVH